LGTKPGGGDGHDAGHAGNSEKSRAKNPWDALANMRAGARYLRQQLDRFGRVDLALAAYNAGPERRSLSLGSIPAIPETRNYVKAITTNWVRLTKLGSPDSAVAARAGGQHRSTSLRLPRGIPHNLRRHKCGKPDIVRIQDSDGQNAWKPAEIAQLEMQPNLRKP
jgi:hypothetical protein